MTDLIAFLRARLDDDEALARQAFAGHNDAGPVWSEIWSGAVQLGEHEDLLITNDSGVSRHIERHDPARILAEVGVKRQVIELAEHASALDVDVDGQFRIGARDTVTEPYIGDEILRHLALPYADHPDYREDWRP